MSVHSFDRPQDNDPVVIMSHWLVFDVGNGEHHLVGWANGEGRVSSAVKEKTNEHIITRSGRRYKLVGSPGANIDAMYVWDVWSKLNSIDLDKVTNVSEKYLVESLSNGT